MLVRLPMRTEPIHYLALVRAAELPRCAASVYTLLCAMHADPYAEGFVIGTTQRQLAQLSKVTTRSVHTALDWLGTNGWIEARRTAGLPTRFLVRRPADALAAASALDNPFGRLAMVAAQLAEQEAEDEPSTRPGHNPARTYSVTL